MMTQVAYAYIYFNIIYMVTVSLTFENEAVNKKAL